jgi:type IV pilus assembly protein PilP
MSFRRAFPVVAVLLLAQAALAQAPTPAPSPEASPGGLPPGTSDTIKSIIDQEMTPPAGGYVYNPQGRRDPFVSLLKPVSADQSQRQRERGMRGFLIQEVALKGIVKDRGGYIAILLGTDGKSYFVRVGERLYDGQITNIDAATVTFRQEVTDPLATVRSREVKKSLYPSEEGTR